MRALRSAIMLAGCAVWGAAALAQDGPKWTSRNVSDPSLGFEYVELTLEGNYSTPPSVVSAQPSLVIECAGGKVLRSYFSFGAVLSVHAGGQFLVQLEAYIDNVRRPIGVDEVSADRTSAFFPRSELRRMLNARQLRVGAVEFAGPEMFASFTIPDSSPVAAACGQDWNPKRK
jgi:hypothetical protein